MKRILFGALLCLFMLSSGLVRSDDTVPYNIQCWSEGNNFRVYQSAKTEYLGSARFFLQITKLDEKSVQMEEYLGHISGAKFVEGKKKLTTVDFYSQFRGSILNSSLSPTAKKYLDKDFWRFKDLESTVSSYDDGGNAGGYLVVSKKSTNIAHKGTFPAHFVFGHGDHTGGTLDFTCEKR